MTTHSTRRWISIAGTGVLLLVLLALFSPALHKGGILRVSNEMRRMIYLFSAILVQIGIFRIRWNVVIGGQLFSKSLRGLTVYKLEYFGLEGLFMAMALLVLPFAILLVLTKLLPPWPEGEISIPRNEEAAE